MVIPEGEVGRREVLLAVSILFARRLLEADVIDICQFQFSVDEDELLVSEVIQHQGTKWRVGQINQELAQTKHHLAEKNRTESLRIIKKREIFCLQVKR